jgi:RNA polymerase sigma-70 factor (ECF subfamily)
MRDEPPLTDELALRLGVPHSLAPSVGPALAARIAEARLAWHDVRISTEDLMVYLQQHRPADPNSKKAWNSWSIAELYLCCGCLLGNTRAVAHFTARFGPTIEQAVRRQRLSQALQDEVVQTLSEELLVGRPDRPPLLERYGGLGSLEGWLRIVSARKSRQVLQREKRYALVGDERIADELIAPARSSSGALRQPFRHAVRLALEKLSARDLTLIRMRYVDGLPLAQIGRTFRVHSSTVHRWISTIQRRILEDTRETMVEALGLDADGWADVYESLQSHLNITVLSLLESEQVADEDTR